MRELESAAFLQLLDTTWQPWCLTQWAVRVKHSFHHLPQGHEEYNEYCIWNGWKLYQHDDPLQYSEFCLLSFGLTGISLTGTNSGKGWFCKPHIQTTTNKQSRAWLASGTVCGHITEYMPNHLPV